MMHDQLALPRRDRPDEMSRKDSNFGADSGHVPHFVAVRNFKTSMMEVNVTA
jgi:hypothetical protein